MLSHKRIAEQIKRLADDPTITDTDELRSLCGAALSMLNAATSVAVQMRAAK